MTWFWTFKISGVQTPENDGVTHCENTRESRLNIPSSTSLLPKSVTFAYWKPVVIAMYLT